MSSTFTCKELVIPLNTGECLTHGSLKDQSLDKKKDVLSKHSGIHEEEEVVSIRAGSGHHNNGKSLKLELKRDFSFCTFSLALKDSMKKYVKCPALYQNTIGVSNCFLLFCKELQMTIATNICGSTAKWIHKLTSSSVL